MEKPTKRESITCLIVIALVIFAWLCRVYGIPWIGGCNPFRAVIYPVVFIYWGFTLHRRLIHDQERHLAVSIACVIIFWFLVRTIKYLVPDQYTDACRFLWYLYYPGMVFIPLLAFLTAMTIGMPETERLSKKYGILWFFATALVLLVITNDLHQLVFAFPDNGTAWTDKDYSYCIGYYIISIWVLVGNLATMVILMMKSRRPKSHRMILFPCIPLIILIGYWYFYVQNAGWLKYWFGDMTAFCCVMYALTFELCIRCGLIRSNSGYGDLFRAGRMGAQITDENNRIYLASANTVELTGQQVISAEEHSILLGKTTLLKSKPIRMGHVLWQEDVSELMEAIEDSEENLRDLSEQHRIRQENLEAERTILALQEKNRVYDLLQCETAVQMDLINHFLMQYDNPDQEDRTCRRFLAGAAVVGAYIKRYGNLRLVGERNRTADISDLKRCFEESFLNLELLGADCLCTLPADVTLQVKDMLHIYSFFEAVLEDCLFTLSQIWIKGREKEGQLILHMEYACSDDLSRHATEADGYSFDSEAFRFTFYVQECGVDAGPFDSETSGFTSRVQKGGAE